MTFTVKWTPSAVVEEENAVAVTSEVGNCAVLPYDFYCEVDTKCDCSASKDAEIDGECGEMVMLHLL